MASDHAENKTRLEIYDWDFAAYNLEFYILFYNFDYQKLIINLHCVLAI